MVFIRPYVMRDKESYSALTNERYATMRSDEEEAKLPWHLILPIEGGPTLPELKLDNSLPAAGDKQPTEKSPAAAAQQGDAQQAPAESSKAEQESKPGNSQQPAMAPGPASGSTTGTAQ